MTGKKKATIGILAHVDAGKTTLAEALLYTTGVLKAAGRVDRGDSFLDNFSMERARGITIFSKEAKFETADLAVTLIDTPGHEDFAPQAERTLQILDAAILVISGSEGVQSHTETLFRLLQRHHIPIFVFVNKMDISTFSHQEIIKELNTKLNHSFVDFTVPDILTSEDMAAVSEELMESFFESGTLSKEKVKSAINFCQCYPVYFGSALKLIGTSEFLEIFNMYFLPGTTDVDSPLSARVYKITRDSNNVRLTHMKILSGRLNIRDEVGEEKVNGIRFYNGEKYKAVENAEAGDVIAVSGLTQSFSGQVIGEASATLPPMLSPVMESCINLPIGTDVQHAFKQMQEIAEELPDLNLVWNEETKEILAQIMGEIQIEVLKNLFKERLNLDASFGVGKIIYKETVSCVTEGVGHFEPLRHYAEVHLKIEPGERGSGIQIDADVSTDELELNWQRLIMTHIAERRHRGVLTGSALTDVKITVIGGRAHPKHTEGGDFRQATYRAIRHGLMYSSNVLLEPYYDFMLTIPSSQLGRAMTDITRMNGETRTHEINGDRAVIYGKCPVSTMHGYALEVKAYTGGSGNLSVSNGGYDKCHNPEEVISAFNYSPSADIRHTPDSVFCAHGSGFVVPWDQVTSYMHIESKLDKKASHLTTMADMPVSVRSSKSVYDTDSYDYSASRALDKELADIFNRTYGSSGRSPSPQKKTIKAPVLPDHVEIKETAILKVYLLVDGYNIIFSEKSPEAYDKVSLDMARQKLIERVANYAGFKGISAIVVFDAYRVTGGTEKVEIKGNTSVVYTKEAETADQFIERTSKSLSKKYRVRVATSDATEQIIIFGTGAERISAPEFLKELEYTEKEISDNFLSQGRFSLSTF